MNFTKMQGLGNDYLYVYGEVPEDIESLSRKLSDRHFGAGSDGMIYISPSEAADFKMRIFNADGSEAMMCGNGIRCVGKYVYDKGYTDKTHLAIETLSGIKTLDLDIRCGRVRSVTVDMGRAEVNADMEIPIGEDLVICTPVSVGNPHAVIFISDIEKAPVSALGPLLENNHELVADAAEAAQNALNAAAGLGLKAVRPTLNQSRVDGLIDKVSSYENFEDAAWVLDEPVVNFTQSVVDDAIRENVAAQARAGLSPTVKRIAESGCCPWCSNLEGTYEYPVERDVYRRHERCRCLVLFDPKTGKVQNAHTKVQYANAKKAERDSRVARMQELLKQKEQAASAKREMLRKLEAGEYKLKLLPEKSGSAAHHRSVGYGDLSISRDEQQRLINSLSGLGTPRIGKNGRAQNIEFVTADRPIGTITEYFPEKRVIETRRMAIVHTRDGSYIVPVKPGRTS